MSMAIAMPPPTIVPMSLGIRFFMECLPNNQGERREAAAGGVGFVSERIGWLPFAGPSGWAPPGCTGPLLNRTAVRHSKLVIRISASPNKNLWTLRFSSRNARQSTTTIRGIMNFAFMLARPTIRRPVVYPPSGLPRSS
jgi:hypothetical protein